MKISPRFWFCLLILLSSARADPAHVSAMKQLADNLAQLEGVYVAVHAKKEPLKALETALTQAEGKILSAADQPGISAELSSELRATAALFGKTVRLMVADSAEDEPRFFRAADDLAELTRLATRLGGSIAPANRLTAAERRELSAYVESRFGKRDREFPRGDTSPFASGSRSPFASAMFTISLSFDDTLKRDLPVGR